MLRILGPVLAFGLVVFVFAANDENKDFSGHWKMDRARSESPHQSVPLAEITLAIKRTAAELSIETITSDGQQSRISSETLTYKLDGTESTVETGPGAPVKTRLRWDGPKLVTETVRVISNMSVTVQNVLTLGPDRNELTVDRTLTVQHGYQSSSGNNTGTGRDVFVRTSTSRRK